MKTTPSGSSETTKEQDSTKKTDVEDKEDDRDGTQEVDAENPDGDADVEADGEEKADNARPRSDSLKEDYESADTSNVDSANTTTTTAAAASASSPTVARLVGISTLGRYFVADCRAQTTCSGFVTALVFVSLLLPLLIKKVL